MAYLDTILSAQDVVNQKAGAKTAQEFYDELRVAAGTAGVTRSEYIDYADALANFESRDDVEPLSERRAREAATTFAATDFRREGDGSAVITSPADKNI